METRIRAKDENNNNLHRYAILYINCLFKLTQMYRSEKESE